MLVIIHGWSDDYRSFKKLGHLLVEHGVSRDVRHVQLGNYISLDDEVRLGDIVAALQTAWKEEHLPIEPRSVDVVVHSTGGLIIRHWISTMPSETIPIRRLLMLAPANFGSPLAHTGRSVFGRVVKGWGGRKLFQTGSYILKGLELASPYSWDLAFKERFGSEEYYGPGKILCTVLVGNSGYSGISALANKPGSDGTVRVSTANMECAYLEADFSQDPLHPSHALAYGKGRVAFGVMDHENHSTIAAKDGGPKKEATLRAIIEALRIDDDTFEAWQKRLSDQTEETMGKREGSGLHYHGFQNTVFRVSDDLGDAVKDYVIEFYVDEPSQTQRNNRVTQKIQEEVIANVHPYSDDSSFVSMLIDCTALNRILDRPDEKLKISLTAHPDFAGEGDVGYLTYGDDDIGSIELSQAQVRELFQPNRTLLVHIVLKRMQSRKVFELKPLTS